MLKDRFCNTVTTVVQEKLDVLMLEVEKEFNDGWSLGLAMKKVGFVNRSRSHNIATQSQKYKELLSKQYDRTREKLEAKSKFFTGEK